MLRLALEKLKSDSKALRSDEVERYEHHFELLQAWNKTINLVSRKSIHLAATYHYFDSIESADFAAPLVEGRELIDVGTGAGFPGIIFAIRYPELQITLFEKSLKKQTFLSAVVTQLQLSNVSVEGQLPEGKRWAFCFARALFPREKFFRFFRDRLLAGSRLVANSGAGVKLSQPTAPFVRIKEARYSLPSGAGERKIEAFHVEQLKR